MKREKRLFPYVTFYSHQRPHRVLDGHTPEQAYCS